MSERKVLNKYYPPDFDPSKIPRRKLGKDRQQVVRLMAPFSMQCKACSEFIYKGKKFNARKETAEGETYFGIKIFRFYIKCPRCSNEITFKTDPKHTDYVAEHGAQRNFEPWREAEAHDDEEDDLARLEAAEAEETEEDAMRALENRQADSKREMDILDKLQEIRTRNARLERTDADTVLKTVSSRVDSGLAGSAEIEAAERRRQEAQEDEAEVARYFAQVKDGCSVPPIELGPALETEEDNTVNDDSGPQPGPSTLRPSIGASTTPSMPHTNAPDSTNNESPTNIQPLSASSAKFIKRKADGQEPGARSLLSEEALKVASMDFSAPPPKKKKAVSALGVVGLKAKAKAK